MVLSKQERILVIVTVLVLGIWAANAVVVEPLSDLRRQTANEKLELQGQLEQARNTFNRRKALERKWKGLLSEGMQSDADAEIRIARALTEWSKQTGMSLSSLTPERTTTDKGMKEVTFVVAGQGDLEGVASFLYRVETAELPVKVTHMQLGSSSESGDSMSLQLRLSAIYAGASQKAAEKTSKKQTESSDEEELF
jgi:Tfp pilus assembly protein PilO